MVQHCICWRNWGLNYHKRINHPILLKLSLISAKVCKIPMQCKSMLCCKYGERQQHNPNTRIIPSNLHYHLQHPDLRPHLPFEQTDKTLPGINIACAYFSGVTPCVLRRWWQSKWIGLNMSTCDLRCGRRTCLNDAIFGKIYLALTNGAKSPVHI